LNNKLIAFHDLKRLIIDPGFCTLCGACEAACPIHAIKIIDQKPRRLYDCSEHLDLCPICYDICPHSDALLYEVLGFVADAPHRRGSLGYYRKIVLAQAADPAIREMTRSGGVINALLNFAIDQGIIDAAIFSRASSKLSLKVKPSINLVPDDALSAVDLKMAPSAVAEAFGRAVFEYGKIHIAFVGIPCHVLALRKLEAWQHRIIGSLRIIIGLFCLWTFSLDKLLEYLLHDYKIAANEIKDVDLTMDKYLVTTEDRVVKIPVSEVRSHIMNRCKTCLDFTCEFSDLSIGRAMPLKDWSLVIIRTKKGEEFFDLAVKKKAITVREIGEEPETLAHLISLSTYKRESAMQEIREMREKGFSPLVSADFFVKPTLAEIHMLEEIKVEEIMTRNVVALPESMTVNEFFDQITKHHHIGYPVVDESENLMGIITLQDVMPIPKEERDKVSIGEICTKNLVTIFPENSVAEALEKMDSHNIGRLLVVDKNNRNKLLGILTRSDIMHALRSELS